MERREKRKGRNKTVFGKPFLFVLFFLHPVSSLLPLLFLGASGGVVVFPFPFFLMTTTPPGPTRKRREDNGGKAFETKEIFYLKN